MTSRNPIRAVWAALLTCSAVLLISDHGILGFLGIMDEATGGAVSFVVGLL